MDVAFLCLGVMGYPMAGHLARAGHRVTAYNRTAARAQAWCDAHAEFDVHVAQTPAAAVAGAEFVMACTGRDADLQAITLAEAGAFDAMPAGACFVDHTTVSAELARSLSAAAAERGLGWLDAPVSGGQAGAENGALTIMLGGAEADYARAQPLLDCYARKHRLLGSAGSGQLAKMVNQIAIGGLIEALAEALHFGSVAGLDMPAVVDVISQGAAQSWQMENRAGTMLAGEYDFGFAVDWMRKDLGIALAEAERVGVTLPVTEQVDGYYAALQREGGGRLDTSSLMKRLVEPG